MKAIRSSLLLVAAAWTCGAASAPVIDNVPILSEGAGEDAVVAWRERYIDLGNYVEGATDANRVTLFLPSSISLVAEGRILAIFRSELVRPRFADGHQLRSIRKKLEIDCVALRYRELELYGFSRSNMKGPVPSITPPDSWIGPYLPASSAGRALATACAKAGTDQNKR